MATLPKVCICAATSFGSVARPLCAGPGRIPTHDSVRVDFESVRAMRTDPIPTAPPRCPSAGPAGASISLAPEPRQPLRARLVRDLGEDSRWGSVTTSGGPPRMAHVGEVVVRAFLGLNEIEPDVAFWSRPPC